MTKFSSAVTKNYYNFAGTIKELEKQPKKAKIECVTKEFEGNVASTGVIEVKVTGDPVPQIRW